MPTIAFPHTRIGGQLVVEEEMGLVYCAVQKVACTGWKVWLRQEKQRLLLLHSSSSSNRTASTGTTGGSTGSMGWREEMEANMTRFLSDSHHPRTSGLEEPWFTMTEPQAVRALTKEGLFRFVFVRDPFARVLSAYLNKHVLAGGLDGLSRAYWNKLFFSKVAEAQEIVEDDPNALFPFAQFLRYLRELLSRDWRPRVDRHLAPQNLLCALDTIRYDYVGQLEHMAEGLRAVLARLGREWDSNAAAAFQVGATAHATGSSSAKHKYFDQEAYDLVREMYAQDMDIAHNGIRYDPPPDLLEAYGGKRGTRLRRRASTSHRDSD